MRRHRSPWSESLILFSIVLLAIALRIFASGVMHTHQRPSQDQTIANHLLEGRGFSAGAFGYFGPTSQRPPVYPMLLTGIDATFGDNASRNQILITALNIAFSTASLLLIYTIARAIFVNRLPAFLAAGIFAILPTQIYVTTTPQGLCLAVLFFLISIRLAWSKSLQLSLPAGIFAALAILTESILTLPILIFILCITCRRLNFAALMLMGLLTVASPWIYRNTIVHNRFTGITNETWQDLFIGNGPAATGSTHLAPNDSAYDHLSLFQVDQLKRQPEAVRNDLFRTWAFNWISDHPIQYAKLCLTRIAKTIWLDWDHPKGLNGWNIVSRTVLLAGWIIVLISVWHHGQLRSIVACLAIGLILSSIFTVVEARNSILMDIPQLFALCWLVDRKEAPCAT